MSRRGGHWLIDAYTSVWFFTENPEYFSRNEFVPGTQSQTQDHIWALETHLSYDFRPRFWVSLDGNFWRGGKTSINGVENAATRHQSVKVSYAQGAYIRFGGDYRIASVAWQYSWIDRAR